MYTSKTHWHARDHVYECCQPQERACGDECECACGRIDNVVAVEKRNDVSGSTYIGCC